VSEVEELKAELAALKARVRQLEDHRDLTQIVAEYGPSVDSGSANATADLWTEDGMFAVVAASKPSPWKAMTGSRGW
jgi:hypothetical protein